MEAEQAMKQSQIINKGFDSNKKLQRKFQSRGIYDFMQFKFLNNLFLHGVQLKSSKSATKIEFLAKADSNMSLKESLQISKSEEESQFSMNNNGYAFPISSLIFLSRPRPQQKKVKGHIKVYQQMNFHPMLKPHASTKSNHESMSPAEAVLERKEITTAIIRTET